MTVIAVAGALASKPHNGGEAWVRLSWVLGLRRLGAEVWFVEEIEPATRTAEATEWFTGVLERFGLRDRATLVDSDGVSEEAEQALAEADLLLNISGNLRNLALLRLPRRRAYVDLDPGYTQCWHAAGALGPALDQHEELLTVGLRIGQAPCDLPTAGRRWCPIPPPVVLEEWPVTGSKPRDALTTVASWRGGYGRLELDGRLLGQKAHEFRRIADLPKRTDAELEVALAIDPADAADRLRLSESGWRLVDPRAVAGTPDRFRTYVQRSYGELSPAQGVYVETQCGWFSDRTTRYLASGRPAIVQDTSLPSDVPVGEGLLTFTSVDDALCAIDAVTADYDRHCRAARQLAETHFDSDRVLGYVLEALLP